MQNDRLIPSFGACLETCGCEELNLGEVARGRERDGEVSGGGRCPYSVLDVSVAVSWSWRSPTVVEDHGAPVPCRTVRLFVSERRGIDAWAVMGRSTQWP